MKTIDTTMFGKVIVVETRNLGEPTVAAALAGDSLLYVADAATFDEAGGQVSVSGVALDYVSIDADEDTILLAAPLGADLEEQSLVEVLPATPVTVAHVDLGDDGDLLPVTVPNALLNRLTDGIRDSSEAESVTLEQRSMYEYVITDVLGEPAPTTPASTDGETPAASPAPTVTGGIGALFVRWPAITNADPVTYEVHLSTVDGFTPDGTTLVGTTPATSLTLKTLPSGDPLAYDIDYYVKVVATDGDGAAPAGTQGMGRMVRVTGPDVAAEYVYAGGVIADQITGGTIQSDVQVSGSIKTATGGARVELASAGIAVFDSLGDPTTVFGTDGQSTFKGDVQAKSLLVTDGMTVRGVANDVDRAGVLTLTSAVSQSTTAPTVVVDYEQVQLTVGGLPVTGTPLSLCWVASLSRWLVLLKEGSAYRARYFNAAGAEDAGIAPLTTWRANSVPTSVKQFSTHIWRQERGNLPGDERWYLSRNGTAHTSVDASTPGAQRPVIGLNRDTSQVLLLDYDPASPNNGSLYRYSATTGGSGSVGGLGPQAGFNGSFQAVMGGSFDFGSTRTVAKVSASGSFYSFGSTGTPQTSEFFPTGTNNTVDADWDGANFWSLGADGRLYKHTGGAHAWTDSTVLTRTWSSAFTWYDGDSAGTGTHETKPSPRASFTMRKRARFTVTSPDIPDTGDVDDPDRIRIYAANTASATLYLQGTTAVGVKAGVLSAAVFSGATPPATSNFPGAVPAKITNSDGSLEISGDGTIKATRVVQSSPPPIVSASATSVQSMASGTETVITYSTGTAGWWASGNPERVTVPASMAGRYLVIVTYSFASAANGSRIPVLRKNGAALRSWAVTYAAGAACTGTIVHPVDLAVGDYLHLNQYQSSGAALNTHTQPYPNLTLVCVG